MIASIPEDESVNVPNGTRLRAYSHTRTNSSSSSSSSHVTSPVSAPHSSTLSLPLVRPSPPFKTHSPSGSIDSSSDSGSFTSQRSHYSTSEAAAAAALRKVSSVQITSTNNRPRTEDKKQSKISNVAASAAAFAARPKESALNKAKMFARQATMPHLTSSQNRANSLPGVPKRKGSDLTIQTELPPGRTSISERSPLSRPSKELERIASIGSPPVLPVGNSREGGDKIKHHLSFRPRKDTHANTVLSSSSSNSKLTSEQGSIYSFHPSSPGGIHKSLSALELKNLGAKEDREQIADDSWALLCSRVLPLFNGEGLRVPVEDLNNLVVMHLNFRMQQRVPAREILAEFQDLLKIGMFSLDSSLQKIADNKLIPRFVDLWLFFFSQVLPYWEAVFLPLQMEFDGQGQILSAQAAVDYWGRGALLDPKENLNIRRMTLIGFRDWVIIPISDRLESIIAQVQLDFDSARTVTDTAVRILQCISILASIRTGDENQRKVDHLIKILRSTWLSRPRTAKDRRGFVLSKQVG